MYYRYQNTDYRTLPERIRLADGSTRTSLNELSEAELTALGIEFIEGDYPEPPVAPTPLTHKQFMDRFTDSELANIVGEAVTNMQVAVWLKRFELAQEVILTDPQTISGVQALEALGLLTEGRADEILA